jgi:CHAT domain-containing protein
VILRAAVILPLLFSRLSAGSAEGLSRARALEDAGKTTEARAAFELLLREPATVGRDRALALTELSRMDLAGGNYRASIKNGEDAAVRLHSLKDRPGEGNALTIAGLAKMYSGSYDAALGDFQAALKIARETPDRKQEITRLNNISNVLYFKGRYADALDILQTATKLLEQPPQEDWTPGRRQLTAANIAIIYQTLGQYDRALDVYAGLRAAGDALVPQEQAQLLTNMGAIYRRLGDPIKALEAYQAARRLYGQKAMKRGEISVLNNIGIAQAQDLHQPAAAIATFDTALTLARSSGDQLVTLQLVLRRSAALYEMQRFKEARSGYEQGIAMAKNLHAAEETWKALLGRAQLYLGDGDSARAISTLREAVANIESLRGAAPKGLRNEFLADKRHVYDLLIGELARSSRPDPYELFRLMEMSRSRTLQDQTKAVSLNDVRARLPADTLLLEYWLGADSLAVLWITHGGSGLHFKPAEAGLRDRLRTLNQALSSPAGDLWRDQAKSAEPALLSGLETVLAEPSVSKFIVVPDREIALVPFDVLPALSRYTISWLPSASMLHFQTMHRDIIPFWRRTVLAFGDPAPNAAFGTFDMPAARDAGRLPAATGEVRAISLIAGGRHSTYVGAAATKLNLTRGLHLGFPILHLATHAFADPEDPARSYLLLAGANKLQAYDYLFLNEVRSLDLRSVDLVSLSACETELGKMVEGDGVASFSKAFLGAGARTVVTTLWPVGDVTSAELMKAFYSGLSRGLPAGDALRQAKALLAAGRYRHPYYWAAFVLNGDPSVMTPLVIGWPLAAGGLLLAAAVCLLFWSRFRKQAGTVSKFPLHRRR